MTFMACSVNIKFAGKTLPDLHGLIIYYYNHKTHRKSIAILVGGPAFIRQYYMLQLKLPGSCPDNGVYSSPAR